MTTVRCGRTDPLSNQKIEISYRDFEIADSQSLQAWAEINDSMSDVAPEVVVLRSETVGEADGSSRQILHRLVSGEHGLAQTIVLTHGRLMLYLATYTHDEGMTRLLQEIAASVQFAPDAPRTLNELYGTDQTWPSIEEVVQVIVDLRNSREACDTLCREGEEHKDLAFPGSTSDSSPTLSATDGTPTGNQIGLPSNFWSPIQLSSGTVNVNCNSGAHTGSDTYAADIGVTTGTTVVASQSGQVIFSGGDPEVEYGQYIIIGTTVNVAAEPRTYQHLYGHLSQRNVSTGATVTQGQTIGLSGWSGFVDPPGPSGAHLHFHARLGSYPVDLTPVVGFRPNLSYPISGYTCGVIEPMSSGPLVIEPKIFTERYQPRFDHWWYCWKFVNWTTECYMEAAPNNGGEWDAVDLGNPSPELRYGNVYFPLTGTYYIWTCGWGGTNADDSVNMGYNNNPYTSSYRINGYIPAYWRWRSQKGEDMSRPRVITESCGLA